MEVAEPTLTCPYNKAHSIILSRMQFHLTKCRAQYPNAEKTVCPFNTTHVVNKVELEFHVLYCPDRIVLDSFTFQVGTVTMPKVDVAKIEKIEIPGEETWEDVPYQGSVLETVHETSRSKPTLQALIGAPKSERKAFRNQERLRIQQVLDQRDTDTKKSETRSNTTSQSSKENQEKDSHIKKESDSKDETVSFFKDEKPSPVPSTSRQPGNPWNNARAAPSNKTEASSSTTRSPDKNAELNRTPLASGDGASSIARSLGNMHLEPTMWPAKEQRDPVNPWGRPRNPSSNFPAADQNDFPMLPIAGAGRGRGRGRSNRN